MVAIKDFFALAQLAEASYSKFDELGDRDALINDGKGFSATQADLFLADWQLVAGGHQPNTASGFSSTLFKSLDTGGGYVLAIRGTEPTTQLFKDLVEADMADIVADGIVIDQSVDLYNEWKRITSTGAYTAAKLVTLTDETAAYALAKAGQFVPGFNMAADIYLTYLRARTDIIIDEPSGRVRTLQFESSATLFSDGRQTGLGLAADIAAQGITVTGHSLGGHLADIFDRLFAGAGADAFKINGAGFATGSVAGVSDNAATNIRNLFGMLGGAASFDGSGNLNLYGDNNPEIVTMNGPGLFQQGGHEAIFIEQDSFIQDVFGHGASQITDSLAVFDLLIGLDGGLQSATPQAALAKLNPLFEAASNDTAFSLESLVGALGRLFTGNGLIAQDDRESLYGLINDIKQTTLYRQSEGLLTIQPLTEFDAAIIAGKAQQSTADGLAYRYALVNLNPFALTGDASLYASHNAAGQFDLYDPATGQGTLTAQYLKDRAKMLSWKMQYDTGAEDADDDPLGILSRNDKPYTEDWDSWAITGNWDFIDHAALVGGSPLKLTIDGVDWPPAPSHQIAFGTNNADNLHGGALDDNLYGGGGADILTGGGGNDYLEGGTGYDTYVINAGNGFDTIVDVDGLGVVKLGGIDAKGSATPGLNTLDWHAVDSDTWVDQRNGITYTRSVVSGETRLLVKQGDSSVLIKGWSDDALGIVLGAGAPATASNSLIGTQSVDQLINLDMAGWDEIVDAGGIHNQAIPGWRNRYEGQGGADLIWTDFVDDIVDGGSGNDYILALGGGADIISGGGDDDYIHIGDPDPLNDGGAAGLQHIPNNNRDFIPLDNKTFVEGGGGNDTITVTRRYWPLDIALDGPFAGTAFSLQQAGDTTVADVAWGAEFTGCRFFPGPARWAGFQLHWLGTRWCQPGAERGWATEPVCNFPVFHH